MPKDGRPRFACRLRTIRFRSGTDVRMGVLFWRRLSRSGVSTAWPEIRPGQWVFESNAAMVFDDASITAAAGSDPERDALRQSEAGGHVALERHATADGDVGASVKYGFTSAITLDATVNPDFSQVESDAFEVEVNQRFPIFFSEKRPFFMEGMGLFNIAGTGGDSTMRTAVHTRRIIDPSARRQADGLARQAHVRPAFVRRRIARGQRPTTLYRGTRGDELRQGSVRRASLDGHRARHRLQPRGRRRRGVQERRTLPGERIVLVVALAVADRRDGAQGVGAQSSYSYSTRRFGLPDKLEHYDRGFRMDTAFINRVGLTRMWQYQDLNFYPSHPRYRWIKRINPFFWMSGGKGSRAGWNRSLLSAGCSDSTSRAPAPCVSITARDMRHSRAGDSTIGRMKIDGSVQVTRWLNIGGNAQKGPSIFYDDEAPFQGYRRIGEPAHRTPAELTLQPQHVVQLRARSTTARRVSTSTACTS